MTLSSFFELALTIEVFLNIIVCLGNAATKFFRLDVEKRFENKFESAACEKLAED